MTFICVVFQEEEVLCVAQNARRKYLWHMPLGRRTVGLPICRGGPAFTSILQLAVPLSLAALGFCLCATRHTEYGGGWLMQKLC